MPFFKWGIIIVIHTLNLLIRGILPLVSNEIVQ